MNGGIVIKTDYQRNEGGGKMSNITVRTFLKDGTEVTGKPTFIPAEVCVRLAKVIEPFLKEIKEEKEEKEYET